MNVYTDGQAPSLLLAGEGFFGFRPRDTYILGSPGRGAGPAIAGSEGSGFSLEKPRRRRNAGLDIWGARYLRLRRKAWPLAKPDPSVSCADSSALH